jgi:hypothetical protein
MDDAAAEHPDLLERSVEITHGEVRQRERISRSAAALMDANERPWCPRLPAVALSLGTNVQLGAEESGPEPPRSVSVIRRKLDQGKPRVHASDLTLRPPAETHDETARPATAGESLVLAAGGNPP